MEDVEIRILEHDAFGRVVRVDGAARAPRIVRVAEGGRWPGSAPIARLLARRERRALAALGDFEGTPTPVSEPALTDRVARRLGVSGDVLFAREWLAGLTLDRTERLPADFFDHLAALVDRLHAHGVCHNDLHKEQNILVRLDGRPALIDFQLASRHRRAGRLFRTRTRDDLRHVAKVRRRYARLDANWAGDAGDTEVLPRRSPLAAAWRRSGKPLYAFVARRLLGRGVSERGRSRRGPWPRVSAPLGAVPAGRESSAASDPRHR